MDMNIRLYIFSKRENSTKRPGSNAGAVYDCYLKDATSVINPVILIDYADQGGPQAHLPNYAYIPDFDRYYFIADQRSIRGLLWEYSLTCDILATYKPDITNSTLYLLRCSGSFDGNIVDDYYPVKTSHSVSVNTVVTPWLHALSEDPDVNDGCFILGIVSKPGNSLLGSFGSIRYIAMTRANLSNLIEYLLDAGTLTSGNITIDGLSNEAVKSVIDPIQYIKSCLWCPLLYGEIDSTEQTGLNIWSWTAANVSYKVVPNNPPYAVGSASFANIPKHPQAAVRGAYLNTAPFTKLLANIPPFGIVELDTTLAAPVNQIIGLITYDLITGTAILEIHYGAVLSGAPAARIQSQVGVPIQLTQVYNDYINAAGGVIGGVAGAVASALTGNVLGAIHGGISAVGSAVNAMRPVVSSMGGNGGFADLRGQARLYSIFYDVPAEDRAHVGRPLCANVSISTLDAGTYCLAMDGDIPISGTAGEQQSLKAYLEGGFYYE